MTRHNLNYRANPNARKIVHLGNALLDSNTPKEALRYLGQIESTLAALKIVLLRENHGK